MDTRMQNQAAVVVLWLAGLSILGLLAVFLGYILYRGLPVLSLDFVFGKSSDILAGGGVGAQLFNSFYMLALSLGLSIPVALGAGIYLAEYAKETKLTKCIRQILPGGESGARSDKAPDHHAGDPAEGAAGHPHGHHPHGRPGFGRDGHPDFHRWHHGIAP